jgi:CheY-like chemotaxis protein
MLEPHRDSQELYEHYFRWIGLHRWAGLRVTVVRSANRALRIIAHGTHDALITCLRLPETSGFAVCDALHAVPRTGRMPVIALSTCLTDHERALRDGGFAAVLMKPCTPDVLLESLRHVLEGRRRADDGPEPSTAGAGQRTFDRCALRET